MGFAQETFALIDAVRQQPRRARPQQYAALLKAVANFAIETGGAHRLIVVGGIVEFPHIAGLPGEQPRRTSGGVPLATLSSASTTQRRCSKIKPSSAQSTWLCATSARPTVTSPSAPKAHSSAPRKLSMSAA